MPLKGRTLLCYNHEVRTNRVEYCNFRPQITDKIPILYIFCNSPLHNTEWSNSTLPPPPSLSSLCLAQEQKAMTPARARSMRSPALRLQR